MTFDDAPRLDRLSPSRRTETDLLTQWSAMIRSAPDLRGALCAGSDRWDYDLDQAGETPTERTERLERAVAICRRCPVLAQCRSWVETLPPSKRPTGVVGGRLDGAAGQFRVEPVPNQPQIVPGTTEAVYQGGYSGERRVGASGTSGTLEEVRS